MWWLEVLLCGGLLALVPFLLAFGGRRWYVWVASGVLLVGAIAAGSMLKPERDETVERYAPRVVEEGGFVSSQSCKSCHPGEYASWHRTWHRTMTQFPTPESVVGDFDDRELMAKNHRYVFERRGDEFWVTMPDPDAASTLQQTGLDLETVDEPPMVTRKVLLTTGSHHMQTYWVAGSGDTYLVQVPWFYHIADQRWIPADDTFLTSPDQPLSATVWNKNCIRCHVVNPIPGDDRTADHISSRTVELGIACEACHGPAEEHIARHSNPFSRYGERLAISGNGDDVRDPTIVNPKKVSHERSSEICGQCHSVFGARYQATMMRDGFEYEASEDLSASRIIVRYGTGEEATPEEREKFFWLASENYFWKDGTSRAGGDEYLGLLETPCFQYGEMSCLSCHSMHDSDPNDQIAAGMMGNQACLQCHESMRDDVAAHTHHPLDSAGSQCYNCHMPHTSYALYSATRSHRVDNPSVEMTTKFGRPNACNLCHLDQTLEWTGEKLAEWYGQPMPELDDEDREVSAGLQWLLKGDAAQRVITAWHMGWEPAQEASGSNWQTPFLAELLDDDYSAVRYVAGKALATLPGQKDLAYDFLAEKKSRRTKRAEAIEAWRKSERGELPSDPARVLFDSQGAILHQRVKELLEQRDDTPIEIRE